jgi:hypothetical protein
MFGVRWERYTAFFALKGAEASAFEKTLLNAG